MKKTTTSLTEDKRKNRVQRALEPQKAHPTGEFVIVAKKWWPCAASFSLQPCDCGRHVDENLSLGDLKNIYIWPPVFLMVYLMLDGLYYAVKAIFVV